MYIRPVLNVDKANIYINGITSVSSMHAYTGQTVGTPISTIITLKWGSNGREGLPKTSATKPNNKNITHIPKKSDESKYKQFNLANSTY